MQLAITTRTDQLRTVLHVPTHVEAAMARTIRHESHVNGCVAEPIETKSGLLVGWGHRSANSEDRPPLLTLHINTRMVNGRNFRQVLAFSL